MMGQNIPLHIRYSIERLGVSFANGVWRRQFSSLHEFSQVSSRAVRVRDLKTMLQILLIEFALWQDIELTPTASCFRTIEPSKNCTILSALEATGSITLVVKRIGLFVLIFRKPTIH